MGTFIESGSCKILRKKHITESKINISTGKKKKGKSYDKTEQCGTPLFSEVEIKTGVCDTCKKGWEVKGNTFASKRQREIALTS